MSPGGVVEKRLFRGRPPPSRGQWRGLESRVEAGVCPAFASVALLLPHVGHGGLKSAASVPGRVRAWPGSL